MQTQLKSRAAVAVALIQPLSWEPPYAMGTALKKTKQTNKQTTSRIRMELMSWGCALSNPTDLGSIPGLAQWVKDLAMP